DRLDTSLYELEWHEQPRPAAETTGAEPAEPAAESTHGAASADPAAGLGTWLVFADRQGVAASLVDLLGEQGGRAVTVAYGDATDPIKQPGGWVVDPANPEHFAQLLARLEAEPVTQVVHLWSLDAAATETTPLSVLEADQR